MPLVTVSASYGSGGSEVAPAVAERLGVRFVDRVVSPETAHRLAQADNAGRFWRVVRSISPAGGLTAGSIHAERELNDRLTDRESLEAALQEVAADGDAVILGRAGALALRDDPRALHVRLDGAPEARVFRAMEIQAIDEAAARQRLVETDRAPERFVRAIYGLDPPDPASTRSSLTARGSTRRRASRSLPRPPSPHGERGRRSASPGQCASAGSAAIAPWGTPERKTSPQTIAPTTNTAPE